MDRRDFLKTLAVACSAGAAKIHPLEASADTFYDFPAYGNARILHICDSHSQLLPVYFREPNVNLGFKDYLNVTPHIVGDALLKELGIAKDSALAYAISYPNITELAKRYGRMGGFAHLATVANNLRASAANQDTLFLDSGDTWHGSATALYTQGQDMVEASNILGVDAMVGHWEFTYPVDAQKKNLDAFRGDFLAQNIRVKEEALFDGAEAFDEDSGHAFAPYVIKQCGGYDVAVIGQAFPYTPISNPQRFIPDWTFGIRADSLQETVDHVRRDKKVKAVVLLSHNGSDLDAAVAARVSGIDFILGGHTHDIFYQPRVIGKTVVVNTGCVGKFLGCLDFSVGAGGVTGYRWRAVPVFADMLAADATMQRHIDKVRAPYQKQLSEVITTTDEFLYRRGNFNGPIDQIIVDALRAHYNSDIALSPGFRWGTSIAPGDITVEDLMNVTAITYPETYNRAMSGAEIKTILEGVADNLYRDDPFYQHGGDMVRVGGLRYTLHPGGESGKRVSDMRLDSGKPLHADKKYMVSGWATVNLSEGVPIWEIVRDYLQSSKTVQLDAINQPALKGVEGNLGIADYSGQLL